MVDTTWAEREEFKSLKTYPIEYLTPQEIHILKALTGKLPRKISILSFVSLFDDDTRKCFSEHSDALRLLSRERATKSSNETIKKSAVKAIAPFKKAKCFLEILEKGKFIKSIIFPPRSNWGRIFSALETVLMNDSVEDIFSEPCFLENKNLQFEIKFREEGTEKIKKWLNDYLDIFIDNKLTTLFLRLHPTPLVPKPFYSYEKSALFFKKLFEKDYTNGRNTEINIGLDMLDAYWQKLEGGDSVSQSPPLRPIEVILAMEKKEHSFKVTGIGHDRITVKLEKKLKDEIESGEGVYSERTGSEGQNAEVAETQTARNSYRVEAIGGKGWLVIKNERTSIDSPKSRQYRLLEYLQPFGKAKTIGEIFTAIRNEKDEGNSLLDDANITAEAIKSKKKIIKYTIKEIYRKLNKGISGRALRIHTRKDIVEITIISYHYR